MVDYLTDAAAAAGYDAAIRPDVVAAGPDGLVARAPGIATVTVIVRYHGVPARGTFVALVR